MIQFEHSVNSLLHILFHYDFSQDTIGLRCLSILYTIVCICTSQISNPPLPPFTLAITSLFSTFESEETQAFDPGLRVPVSTLSPRSLFHCISIHFFLRHSDCQNITPCQSRFQLSSLRQLLPTTTVDCLIKQSLYLAFKVLPRFPLTNLTTLFPPIYFFLSFLSAHRLLPTLTSRGSSRPSSLSSRGLCWPKTIGSREEIKF